MKIPLIQSPIRLAVMCALALGVFSAPATAQVPAPARDYLIVTDSSGAPIFTGFGECLHAGYGTARQWTPGCDPVVYETVAFDANVMFDSDKSALRPEGRDTLDGFIKKIEGLEAQSVRGSRLRRSHGVRRLQPDPLASTRRYRQGVPREQGNHRQARPDQRLGRNPADYLQRRMQGPQKREERAVHAARSACLHRSLRDPHRPVSALLLQRFSGPAQAGLFFTASRAPVCSSAHRTRRSAPATIGAENEPHGHP